MCSGLEYKYCKKSANYYDEYLTALVLHKTNKTNAMVRVRERTKPTERPPLVGEVIANFCG
jgi:hypothetical protein